MSESESKYDPVAMHDDIDEMYAIADVERHLRWLMRRAKTVNSRSTENVSNPDLFGDYGHNIVSPPVAPD